MRGRLEMEPAKSHKLRMRDRYPSPLLLDINLYLKGLIIYAITEI